MRPGTNGRRRSLGRIARARKVLSRRAVPPWPGEPPVAVSLAAAVINRARPLAFARNGRPVQGCAGDTITSALAGRACEPVRHSPVRPWHEAHGAPLVAGAWIRLGHDGDLAAELTGRVAEGCDLASGAFPCMHVRAGRMPASRTACCGGSASPASSATSCTCRPGMACTSGSSSWTAARAWARRVPGHRGVRYEGTAYSRPGKGHLIAVHMPVPGPRPGTAVTVRLPGGRLIAATIMPQLAHVDPGGRQMRA
jgi:hypothetical protein